MTYKIFKTPNKRLIRFMGFLGIHWTSVRFFSSHKLIIFTITI